jgi:hypothetical protein
MSPETNTSNQLNTPASINPSPALNAIDPLTVLKQSTAPANTIPAKVPLNMDKVPANLTSYIKSRFIISLLVVIVAAGLSIFNPIFAVIIIGIFIAIAKSVYENTIFKAFANSNNFDYQKKGIVPTQTGHLFFVGNSNKISDVISGNYSNRQFLFFLYSYDIGYGKNRRSYHRAVLTISYGVNLPTFIMRRSGIKALLEEEGDKIKSNGYTERLQLEGDFNKHFEVFIPKDTEQDVLTILTPDILELLLPLDKYEIELTPSGDFYLYTFKYITKKQELIDIYRIVEAINIKIGNQAELQKHVLKQIVRANTLTTTRIATTETEIPHLEQMPGAEVTPPLTTT